MELNVKYIVNNKMVQMVIISVTEAQDRRFAISIGMETTAKHTVRNETVRWDIIHVIKRLVSKFVIRIGMA